MHTVTRIASPMIGAFLLLAANAAHAEDPDAGARWAYPDSGGSHDPGCGDCSPMNFFNNVGRMFAPLFTPPRNNGPSPAVVQARTLNDRANHAFDTGDYATAEALYRQALEYSPADQVIRNNLAGALVQEGHAASESGNYAAAARFYQAALGYGDDQFVREQYVQQNLDHAQQAAANTVDLSGDAPLSANPPAGNGDASNASFPARRTGSLAGSMFASSLHQAGPITAPAPTQQAAFGDMRDLRDAVADKPAQDIEAGTITPAGSHTDNLSGDSTGDGMGGNKSAPVGTDFVKDDRPKPDPKAPNNTGAYTELANKAADGTKAGTTVPGNIFDSPGDQTVAAVPTRPALAAAPLLPPGNYTPTQQAALRADEKLQGYLTTQHDAEAKLEKDRADEALLKKALDGATDDTTKGQAATAYANATQAVISDNSTIAAAKGNAEDRTKKVIGGPNVYKDVNGKPAAPPKGLDQRPEPPAPSSL